MVGDNLTRAQPANDEYYFDGWGFGPIAEVTFPPLPQPVIVAAALYFRETNYLLTIVY